MLAEGKFLYRIVRSNMSRLPGPYKATLALTYACNLKCRICSIWKRAKGEELSSDDWGRFFERSPFLSWVGLTGGEVFLRPDLIDIARSLKRYCRDLCVLGIPTNGFDTGTIVSGVESMIAIGLPNIVVTVSIDGPPDVHDRLRGVKGSWQNSVRTIMALEKLRKVRAYASMTLSRDNAGMMDETIGSIRAVYPSFKGMAAMNLNLLHRSEHYYGNTDVEKPDEESVCRDIEKAIAASWRPGTMKGFLQLNYLKRGLAFVRTHTSPLPCRALSTSCFIDPAGQAYPCSIYNRPLGNIRDFDYRLKGLWTHPDTLSAYQACSSGRCPGCWTACDAYPSINGSLIRALGTFLF